MATQCKQKTSNSKRSIFFKFAILILKSLMYTAIFLIGSYLVTIPNIFLQLCLAATIISGYIYYCKSNNLSFLQSAGFVSVLGFLMSYISFRMAYGAILPIISNNLKLTESQLGSFNAIFSLTYGLAQAVVGLLINYFGLYAVGISSICAGVASLTMCLIKAKYTNLYILRGLLGVFCSCGSIGVISYASQYLPISMFNTTIGLAQALGSFMADIVATSVSGVTDWRPTQTKLSIALLASGVLIICFAAAFSIKEKQASNNLSIDSDSQTELKNSTSIQESLKVLFSKKYIMSFLWTSTCCGLMYINNVFDSLIKVAYPGSSNIATKYLALVSGILVLILPEIINTFPAHLSVIYRSVSILQAIGFVVLMLFYRTSKVVIIVSYILFVICGYAHMALPTAVNSDRNKHGDAPFFFGIMNFGTMFFGSYAVQQIVGILIDSSWKKSGAIVNTISKLPVYTARDYISALRYFTPLVIITLISSFFVLDTYSDTKNNNTTDLCDSE